MTKLSIVNEYFKLIELQSELITQCRESIAHPPDEDDPKKQAAFLSTLRREMGTHIRTQRGNLQELLKLKKKKGATPSPVAEPPIPPAWRDDIVEFAREALNVELFDHQRDLCLSESRVNILIAGRGAGKSVAARVKALHHALTRPGHTVLVVSSGQRMSSNFGEQILDLIRQTPLFPFAESISQEQIRFKNNSFVHFLPANPDTIRGYHPRCTGATGGITVILDEACFLENGDEIRKAVEYALITTSRRQGQLYIVSSPSSVGSWVHEYVQMADNPAAEIRVFQCSSAVNPQISAEELERLRATKNDQEYRAEVLGEWVDGAYGLFSGIIEPNLVAPDTPLPPEYACSLGVDLALSFSAVHDRNALAVVAKWWPKSSEEDALPRYRLVELRILAQASDAELRQVLRELTKTYGINTAVVEQYQGKSLAEFLQSLGVETLLVAPTSGLQQMVFHDLHRLLRQGCLELPSSLPDAFFAEMRAFEYRRESNGTISFGHPASGNVHDDTVYALAWALHAANQPQPNRTPSPPPLIAFIEKF